MLVPVEKEKSKWIFKYQKHIACSYGYKLLFVEISLVNLLNHTQVKCCLLFY